MPSSSCSVVTATVWGVFRPSGVKARALPRALPPEVRRRRLPPLRPILGGGGGGLTNTPSLAAFRGAASLDIRPIRHVCSAISSVAED